MSSTLDMDLDRAIQLQELAIDEYRHLTGTRRVSGDLEAILGAALDCRVRTLFVPIDEQVWGTFDRTTRILEWHPEGAPGDVDLIALAVAETLERGGSIHRMDRERIPSGTIAAAMFTRPLPKYRRRRRRRC